MESTSGVINDASIPSSNLQSVLLNAKNGRITIPEDKLINLETRTQIVIKAGEYKLVMPNAMVTLLNINLPAKGCFFNYI